MQRIIYIENRSLTTEATRLAIDLNSHLQSRQFLPGTAAVICHNPHAVLSAVRKQWLRTSRSLQRQRASTLNAEEILRHTRAIMRMQNILFTTKSPREMPHAQVYFLPPDTAHLPARCHTLYVTEAFSLTAGAAASLAEQAVVVDYDHSLRTKISLQPKAKLEARVHQQWQELTHLLQYLNIQPENIPLTYTPHSHHSDIALDTLLDRHEEFLQLAYAFQQTLDTAQPLATTPKEEQGHFAAIMRLAYRVQTLAPYSPIPASAESSMYFLRDHNSHTSIFPHMLFCEAIHPYQRSATIAL